MNKSVVFVLSFCTLLASTLNGYFCDENGCRRHRRYMDPTYADYNGIAYGYTDNINYPDNYALPLNYYFWQRNSCSYSRYDFDYMQNCVRYTNWKRLNCQNSYPRAASHP